MDDLISRQAAIDEIDEWIKAFLESGHKESAADACLIQDGIIQLPSAQTAEQNGRWIEDGKGFYKCSSCGNPWVHWWARVVPPNQMCKELRYCPSCGADMRGEQDEKM